MRLVGILGGTYNPIHYGHLRMAQELAEALNLAEVRFIPSANPPHKDDVTVSAEHRAAMVELAIVNNPLFTLDRCELEREGASFTIDTLIELSESLGGDAALCLIMGSDAFVKLNTWHRWQSLLDYAHIILVQRPSTQPQEKLPSELEALLRDHYTELHGDLMHENAGFITMQNITPQDISATQVRDLLQQQTSVRYLLPNEVVEYIQQQQLYQAPA
ncbi:MAG: nicotinic acid mononucleotide adenylyltransferase [Methylophilaceae bacterium]|nr:MAG: nicotinic acid mononucleotide adenylyltransferase [Methylophilaceae bacterium]